MTLAISLIIAAVWGIWTWKRPFQAFSALPFTLPTYVIRTSIGPLPTTMLELILLATIIAWFFRITNHESRITTVYTERLHQLWNISKTWHIPLSLWLLAGLISIFIAQNHIGALGLYRAYFIEPILIFIIGLDLIKGDRRSEIGDRENANGEWRMANGNASSKTNQSLSSLLASRFSLLLILLGVYAIVQFLTGWGIPYPWHEWAGRRAVGPFPYPNALSLFVAPVTVLLFAAWLRSVTKHNEESRDHAGTTRGVVRTIALMGVISGLISIALAKSDGGFIAVCAGIFIACLFYKKIRSVAVGILIAGLIAIAVISPIRTKILHVVEFKEWSGMVRTVIWKESAAMLKDHPLFGAGLGGYPDAIKPYHKATWMEIFQYPHNIVLNLWSETGLLGIVAFGWIIWEWVSGIGYRVSNKSYVLPIIITILVHGLVDVPYFKNDLAVMFWLLILATTIGDTMTDRA